MRLYIISSEFEYKAVIDFTYRLYPTVNSFSFRINGNYSDTQKIWFINNDEKTPLIPQIAPNQTYCHCLQILGDYKVFKIAEFDCNIAVSSFLEYIAVPTPTPLPSSSDATIATATTNSVN